MSMNSVLQGLRVRRLAVIQDEIVKIPNQVDSRVSSIEWSRGVKGSR